MPYKDPEKKKEYAKKYKDANREKINRKKREHYAKNLAHPRVLLTPEQRKANALAAYKKYNAENKERRKQYKQDNKERLSAYGKEYYQKNKEELNWWHKEHYENNKETILARHKEWREANTERCKQLSKEWRLANKERVAEKNKAYAPIWSPKRKDSLSFAKQCLKYGTKLRNKDIPIELAEVKLLQLQIQRELKDADQRP